MCGAAFTVFINALIEYKPYQSLCLCSPLLCTLLSQHLFVRVCDDHGTKCFYFKCTGADTHFYIYINIMKKNKNLKKRFLQQVVVKSVKTTTTRNDLIYLYDEVSATVCVKWSCSCPLCHWSSQKWRVRSWSLPSLCFFLNSTEQCLSVILSWCDSKEFVFLLENKTKYKMTLNPWFIMVYNFLSIQVHPFSSLSYCQ